ncbi:MAG: sodium/proline symporter PutP [Spirochaetes bacterium]|nr:sodium/proline symporter PutP [Spirochaetota bacterium]
MELPIVVSFIVYYAIMLAIGLYAYRRASHVDDFFLGGRKLGKWVTAISAQASDMSGWLLMGLPGAVYSRGVSALWIALGLFAGTYANWKFVSKRLRIYTATLHAITIPIFFERRFNDTSGLLRIVTSLITLFFFTIYVSSGFVASGKLFEEVLGIDYPIAVMVGSGIIVAYTFLGGFLAVAWTDLLQGMIMVCGIILTVAISYFSVHHTEGLWGGFASHVFFTGIFPEGQFPFCAVISLLGWGLGYFGQPHILVRFMAINSAENIPAARKIALWWLVGSLGGAIAIGMMGISLVPGLQGGAEEKVYIYMTQKLFPPLITGFLLSALLSAIMSTADSQLLVCSSNLTEDIYLVCMEEKLKERKQVIMGRLSVILVSAVAIVFALERTNTVFSVVSHAWGGFGAAFGPVVLFALFSRNTTHRAALVGMIVGTAVLIVWKAMGLSEIVYELVPGFFANFFAMLIINAIFPQKDQTVLKVYEEVVESCK